MRLPPLLRFPTILVAAFAMTSCDTPLPGADCGGSTTGSAFGCSQASLELPGVLVGSWVASPNAYATAHMVLRADGSGHSIGESGTRRDIFALTWWADDSTLFLSRAGAPDSRTYWSVRHDSLWIVSGWGTPWRDTTAIFVRETEPSLVPSPGSIEPRMVGSWTGFSPSVSDHYSNDVLVGKNTAWEPESFQFLSGGTGVNVTFREAGSEDSSTGAWVIAWVPDDTIRFNWWIGGEYLYTEIWNPMANPPSAKDVVGTQVTKWAFHGDSLLITKLWGTPVAKRFGRSP